MPKKGAGKGGSKKPLDVAIEGAAEVARAGGEFVGTTIKLARDVWEAAKIRAMKQGITLAKLVENALRKALEEAEKEEG